MIERVIILALCGLLLHILVKSPRLGGIGYLSEAGRISVYNLRIDAVLCSKKWYAENITTCFFYRAVLPGCARNDDMVVAGLRCTRSPHATTLQIIVANDKSSINVYTGKYLLHIPVKSSLLGGIIKFIDAGRISAYTFSTLFIICLYIYISKNVTPKILRPAFFHEIKINNINNK